MLRIPTVERRATAGDRHARHIGIGRGAAVGAGRPDELALVGAATDAAQQPARALALGLLDRLGIDRARRADQVAHGIAEPGRLLELGAVARGLLALIEQRLAPRIALEPRDD